MSEKKPGTKSAIQSQLLKKLDKNTDGPKEHVSEIEVSKLIDNPFQPRMEYDQKTIKELADSIREEGLLQPIMVTKRDGQYIIVLGHRRKRAFDLLKRKKIPVTLAKDLTDVDLMIIAQVENVQRENMSLIEEALGYVRLGDAGLELKDIAKRVGKDTAQISRIRNLLKLSDTILEDLRVNKSTKDVHALSALRKIEDDELQNKLYFEFLDKGREWLQDEVKNCTCTNDKKQNSPLSVKKNKLTLDLNGLDEEKVKMIKTYIQEVLSTK